MSYQVLARKWRPAKFDEVVGQSHVVTALSNALDQDRVHHAFLFTGTRGVGKTTLARIFAKALNCEKGVSANPCGECTSCVAVSEGRFLDLIEVDAASRTKVDDTRELLENVQYAPTQGRYKIYLIDEVHMLSTHSFNALLKTLEEPPEHVKFLLATTDPQKLPMTVLSRCIQFSLNAIELKAIEDQLAMILENEDIQHELAALTLLARAANGSLRDGLSLLDQAIAYCDQNLTEDSVRKMLGLVDGQAISMILKTLASDDANGLLGCAGTLCDAAQDLKTALDELLSNLHAIALYQFAPDAIKWKGIDADEIAELATLMTPETVQLYYQIALKGKQDFALAPDPRTGFEMVLLRLLAFSPSENKTKPASNTPSVLSNAPNDRTEKPSKPASPESSKKHNTNNLQDQIAAVSVLVDATEAEPLLENGLQNSQLQQHLKTASDIKKPAATPNQPKEIAPEDAENEPTESPKPQDIQDMIGDIGAWSDFIVKTGLKGMARQLAVHMTPQSFDNNILSLVLDPQYGNLQSKERVEQINTELQKASGQQFKLNISLGEVERNQTAARVLAERERASLEKTREDFKNDENVKELVSLFDAEVDESSIKRVN